MFVLIERQTSIQKMVIREVILLKPKHQSYLSQRGEFVMTPNHEKKEDYYVNPCLSQ